MKKVFFQPFPPSSLYKHVLFVLLCCCSQFPKCHSTNTSTVSSSSSIQLDNPTFMITSVILNNDNSIKLVDYTLSKEQTDPDCSVTFQEIIESESVPYLTSMTAKQLLVTLLSCYFRLVRFAIIGRSMENQYRLSLFFPLDALNSKEVLFKYIKPDFMFSINKCLTALRTANLSNLMPYLDLANTTVEEITYRRPDYFVSVTSKKNWHQTLEEHANTVNQLLEKKCIGSYLSFFLRLVQQVRGQPFGFSDILTKAGLDLFKCRYFSSIQLPLTCNYLQSSRWYFSKTIETESANELEEPFANWNMIPLSIMENYEKDWVLENGKLKCDWLKLYNLLNALRLTELKHHSLQPNNQVPEISDFSLIDIRPENSHEFLLLVWSLMQAKLWVEGDQNWTEITDLELTSMDSFDFRNVLLQVYGLKDSLQYLGQLMIFVLEIGIRKNLFNKQLVAKKNLKQRFQMWHLRIESNSSRTHTFYSDFQFSQEISLPYKGIQGLNPSVYDPKFCNLSEIKELNWEQMELRFQTNLNEWNGKRLCDAEVRHFLAQRLIFMLVWIQSIKNDNGKVIVLKKDDIIFDQNVEFLLEEIQIDSNGWIAFSLMKLMVRFHLKPQQLMYWMIKRMQWMYTKNNEVFPNFSYTIYPAMQIMNKSDLILNIPLNDSFLDYINLPLKYSTLLQKSQTIRNKSTTYVIEEVLTLLVTDLMTLVEHEFPKLFALWQKTYSDCSIRLDVHMVMNLALIAKPPLEIQIHFRRMKQVLAFQSILHEPSEDDVYRPFWNVELSKPIYFWQSGQTEPIVIFSCDIRIQFFLEFFIKLQQLAAEPLPRLRPLSDQTERSGRIKSFFLPSSTPAILSRGYKRLRSISLPNLKAVMSKVNK